MDVRPPYAVEGRSLSAVAHLALLGVKIIGTGILGTCKNRPGNRSIFIASVIELNKQEEAV